MKPEELAVVSPNQKKDDAKLRHWHASEQLKRRGEPADAGEEVELPGGDGARVEPVRPRT